MVKIVITIACIVINVITLVLWHFVPDIQPHHTIRIIVEVMAGGGLVLGIPALICNVQDYKRGKVVGYDN